MSPVTIISYGAPTGVFWGERNPDKIVSVAAIDGAVPHGITGGAGAIGDAARQLGGPEAEKREWGVSFAGGGRC